MNPPVHLLLSVLLSHTLSTVSSWTYNMSALCTSSAGLGLAEFTAVVLVGELEVAHYDQHTRALVPTQTWVQKVTEEKSGLWGWQQSAVSTSLGLLKNTMEDQMNSSSGGGLVLQASVGCEWDPDTGQTSSFLHFSLNAQDFLRFTPETQSWTTLAPEAERSRDMFEGQTQYWKHYLTEECPRWLQTLVQHRHSPLLRPVLPVIQLIHGPGSYVSCQARGFYPERALLFWTIDSEELHEGVEFGDVLPNGDGTFQTRVDLDLSQVQRHDWKRYNCVFQLYGVNHDIIRNLEERKQPEHTERTTGKSVEKIIFLVIFLGLCICALFWLLCLLLLLLHKKIITPEDQRPQRPSSRSTSFI